MRNLRAIRYEQWRPPARFNERLLTATTWDNASDSIICCFGPNETDGLIELVRVNIISQKYDLITSWDAPPPSPDLKCDWILDLHFFEDSSTTCLVLAGGDIIVVREDTRRGEDRIEIVGSVDAGIATAKWSPDDELLCIISKVNTVILMSRTFEGIKNISMTSEDANISKHVNVGWGKKETQFKGKGAKALRDPTVPDKIDEGILSPNDDHSVCASWRGDGAFVAVNTVEGGSRRIIRIYSREGVLDSVSEPVDGLEGALSWRPAGNIIAGAQRMPDHMDVVFFERNGLRHGQFSLRLKPEQSKLPGSQVKLSWNSDSTVLAVIIPGCVQLWITSNYHWYLKQEIDVAHASSIPFSISWHTEEPLRFLTNSSSSITNHEYILSTARGSMEPPRDNGTIAVIDGHSVLITPFQRANVPPPDAMHQIVVEFNVVDVVFNADSSLVAILDQHGISLFSWEPSNTSALAPVEVRRLKLDAVSSTSTYQQICFSSRQQLCVLERNGLASRVHHCSFQLNDDDETEVTSKAEIKSVSVGSSGERSTSIDSSTSDDTSTSKESDTSGDTTTSIDTPQIVLPASDRSSRSQSTALSDMTGVAGSDAMVTPLIDLYASISPQVDFGKQNWNAPMTSDAQNNSSPFSPLLSPRNAVPTKRTDVAQKAKDEDPADSRNTSLTGADHSAIAMLGNSVVNGSIQAIAQDYQGNLFNLTIGDQMTSLKFSTFLPWYTVVWSEGNYVPFGLSYSGQLFADSRILAKNCTSFLVTNAHVVFTTTSHLLKFVHLTNIDALEVPSDDPEIDERCRSVERGARLVTAVPTKFSVILQMPRGNLETIFPRAMVVPGIRNLIEKKDYRRAFTTCRTQRVDMNLLYDHTPDRFISDVPLFVTQVQKISYIDLFLSSLTEEDVTQTKYLDTRRPPLLQTSNSNIENQHETRKIHTGKVNGICDAFITVLKPRLATNLQNVITANLCKSPPALEDGLGVIAQLLDQAEETLVDQAAEHICFLADVKTLYNSALGMYNLDLALIIAQKSQQDPREYLPFMQNLQELDELRRRFRLDDHLGRYEKGLDNLFTMQSFAEAQAYTKKHTLYQKALLLYRYMPTELATLTNMYAQYLESISSMKEAAVAYESLQDYTKATSSYLSSGPSQWREALSCALSQTPPLSGQALQETATYLCSALIESKDYASAATIQVEYLNSPRGAAESLCKGCFFADAIHLVMLKQTPNLLEKVIDVGLADALASSTELLADCKAQLLAQVPRLRELRTKALADPLAFYEGERAGDGDLPDDVSVAASSHLSTNNSLFTRYTGKGGSIGTAGTGVSRATSKNRRREERKRARGKKGSVYEEEYLVTSVGRLIERVERSRDEIERLIVGLVRRRMWERARAMEALLAEVVEMCSACVPEVFRTIESVKQTVTNENDVYTPVGGDAVLQESLEAGIKPRTPPTIKAFERLCLLDS